MFSKQVVTDPGREKWVHMSYCSPCKVREMVTHLFIKDNSNGCTMLLI